MQEYINQLKKTYDSELYYFTLIGTMTLIDSCAGLNSTDGETNSTHFKNWYIKYLPEYNPLKHIHGDATGFSADECYKFRCRLLHQGQARIDAKSLNTTVKTGNIAFMVGTGKIHCCNANGIYFLDIENFMNDVIAGVYKWLEETKDVEYVKLNLSKLIKIRNQSPTNAFGSGSDSKYIY